MTISSFQAVRLQAVRLAGSRAGARPPATAAGVRRPTGERLARSGRFPETTKAASGSSPGGLFARATVHSRGLTIRRGRRLTAFREHLREALVDFTSWGHGPEHPNTAC